MIAEPKRAYKTRGTPPIHGTRYTYVNLKCRCDACRACNADYEKARRTRPSDPPSDAIANVRFSIALRSEVR